MMRRPLSQRRRAGRVRREILREESFGDDFTRRRNGGATTRRKKGEGLSRSRASGRSGLPLANSDGQTAVSLFPGTRL